MEDVTRKFTAIDNKAEMKEILSSVYNSLVVKGYNPINQLVGYILSEDPTYITNYNNARSLICRLDRDVFRHVYGLSELSGNCCASAGASDKLSGQVITPHAKRPEPVTGSGRFLSSSSPLNSNTQKFSIRSDFVFLLEL